jgi:AAA+ ATPase superfamily predicted ATPase
MGVSGSRHRLCHAIAHLFRRAPRLHVLDRRLKRSADEYLNQKLDEIESRIDRKLDEIDRRLAEWRDKEIANRIRILKITLWASVIVGAFSLIYSYVKEELNPTLPPSIKHVQPGSTTK